MWRNYLTVGLRALTRNRTYAFINVFGLALGLAACLLLLVYVRYETTYENWQEGSDRVFQVQATWHEVGQPLHAFDIAKLEEQRIVVRRAGKDEKLKTLDGVERKLDETMLVIADAKRPVALAGVMGGEDSEISQQTTDVLIESAYFNPESVRQTARKLGMDTEASRRFERGADRENVVRAQTRCVELICEIAGGVATEDSIDVHPGTAPEVNIEFHPARVEALTSLQVPESEMERIFKSLGFVQNHQTPAVRRFTRPTWRVDVELEEDLVEEVARHWGYDKIASELPPTSLSGEYQQREMKQRALRRSFKAMGFDEAIN